MITVALLGVDVTRHHTLAALWGSSGARPDEDTVMRNFGKTVVIMLDVSVAGLVVASEGGGSWGAAIGSAASRWLHAPWWHMYREHRFISDLE
jgi:hypothetical protein